MIKVQHQFQEIKMDFKTWNSSKKKLRAKESLLMRAPDACISKWCDRQCQSVREYNTADYCLASQKRCFISFWQWQPIIFHWVNVNNYMYFDVRDVNIIIVYIYIYICMYVYIYTYIHTREVFDNLSAKMIVTPVTSVWTSRLWMVAFQIFRKKNAV